MKHVERHPAQTLDAPTPAPPNTTDPNTTDGRPGSPAPHVALDWDGQRISTLDLFGSGYVLMATKPGGHAWMEAGRLVKDRLGIQLTRLLVNDELLDVDGRFPEQYGVRGGGAVLIRPDGYVAWRSPDSDPNPAATLEHVLRQLLNH
ncbi:hypothetical protein AB0I81_32625 [Nonomuraea sp. NPDC050404]|uniref:aromatic-ring hydroxylase C-terminal domain-containing protein n=1 Tax=Nonomuraea sp. NPDC050404 TaxID=3155783 RepID=UPI00340D4A5E